MFLCPKRSTYFEIFFSLKSPTLGAGLFERTWHGNSPDHNPIEKCCYIILNMLYSAKIVAKKNVTKSNNLQQSFNRFRYFEIARHYMDSSLPDRCKAVIAVNGRSKIKY